MKKNTNPNASKPLTRREKMTMAVAAGVLGVTAVGGAAAVNYGAEAFSDIKQDISDVRHEQELKEQFSEKRLFDKMLQAGTLDREDIIVYKVDSSDRFPAQVAEKLHAYDTDLVTTIIVNQEGGAGAMDFDDNLVIPKELLDMEQLLAVPEQEGFMNSAMTADGEVIHLQSNATIPYFVPVE